MTVFALLARLLGPARRPEAPQLGCPRWPSSACRSSSASPIWASSCARGSPSRWPGRRDDPHRARELAAAQRLIEAAA